MVKMRGWKIHFLVVWYGGMVPPYGPGGKPAATASSRSSVFIPIPETLPPRRHVHHICFVRLARIPYANAIFLALERVDDSLLVPSYINAPRNHLLVCLHATSNFQNRVFHGRERDNGSRDNSTQNHRHGSKRESVGFSGNGRHAKAL